MITHQTPDQILQAATPEQKILWNYVFLRFGVNIAISQIYYNGATAGSEFLTYVSNKIFLAYQINTEASGGNAAAPGILTLYDENNVASNTIGNPFPYWDATAAALRYAGGYCQANNIYFSRILPSNMNRFGFIGYRIMF
jgi:hypothetical protein